MNLLLIFAFLLFLLYDCNDVFWNSRGGKLLFPVGGIILAAVSVIQIVTSITQNKLDWTRIVLFGITGVIMGIVLVYTLFFALPFEATYCNSEPKGGQSHDKQISHNKRIDYDNAAGSQNRPLCTTGMYALCRHPGVLWMAAMYACIWGAVPCLITAQLFFITTVCNTGYVIFQDVWTFPKVFQNYQGYRKTTPFLVPTMRSINRCRFTYKEGKKRYEARERATKKQEV